MAVACLRVFKTANNSRNSCFSFKTLEEFGTSLICGEEMSCLSQFILFFRCRESYRIVRFEIDGLPGVLCSLLPGGSCSPAFLHLPCQLSFPAVLSAHEHRAQRAARACGWGALVAFRNCKAQGSLWGVSVGPGGSVPFSPSSTPCGEAWYHSHWGAVTHPVLSLTKEITLHKKLQCV